MDKLNYYECVTDGIECKNEITEEEKETLKRTFAYEEVEKRYKTILADRRKDTFIDSSSDYIKVYIAQFIKHPNIYRCYLKYDI